MTRPFLLAQLSDLHIGSPGLSYGVVDTGAMLRACIEDVIRLRQRPDAVVISGDLTDHSSATGLVSHTAYIGEFAGPYPFR